VSKATQIRNDAVALARDAVIDAFQREHPCPPIGQTTGPRRDYRKDHVVPLECGGPDTFQTSNGRRSAMRGLRTPGTKLECLSLNSRSVKGYQMPARRLAVRRAPRAQASDKPRGRKPRAGVAQRSGALELWGFESRGQSAAARGS
jgi:hypothetical protein